MGQYYFKFLLKMSHIGIIYFNIAINYFIFRKEIWVTEKLNRLDFYSLEFCLRTRIQSDFAFLKATELHYES